MQCLQVLPFLLPLMLMLLQSRSLAAAAGLPSSLGLSEGGKFRGRIRRAKRSTGEISLEALLTLVQQHSTTIDRLEQDLSAYKSKMDTRLMKMKHKVDTASKSVAFTARISDCRDTDDGGLTLTHHQTVVFDDVVTNVGDAYNYRTGIFTAPVSGTYVFSLQHMPNNRHQRVYLAIVKNTEMLQLVSAESSMAPNAQGSSQVSANLNTGDKVWVRQHIGDRVRASWWTVFTGFLLHAH